MHYPVTPTSCSWGSYGSSPVPASARDSSHREEYVFPPSICSWPARNMVGEGCQGTHDGRENPLLPLSPAEPGTLCSCSPQLEWGRSGPGAPCARDRSSSGRKRVDPHRYTPPSFSLAVTIVAGHWWCPWHPCFYQWHFKGYFWCFRVFIGCLVKL